MHIHSSFIYPSRGITLNNNIVGLAYVGTMCGSSATAETQDGGRTLEATASTAAHELGHNLNMAHDDDPSRNCKDIFFFV